MFDKKMVGYCKIAGCISVYVLFVVLVFAINIQNNTLLVLLSTFIGSVVVVASYHEYRVSCIHAPGLKKTMAKALSSTMDEQPVIAPVCPPSIDANAQPMEEWTDEDGIPKFDLTMFSPEIMKKVEDMHVDDEIQDEILNALINIPPEQRIKYIDDAFNENYEFEASY